MLEGRSLNGDVVVHEIRELTLIVAVKLACDGCRDFVLSDLTKFFDLPVVIVSATDDPLGEWAGSSSVLVAPGVLQALEIRWPPLYALVDERGDVVTEGVVFGPSQVAAEIAPYLTR